MFGDVGVLGDEVEISEIRDSLITDINNEIGYLQFLLEAKSRKTNQESASEWEELFESAKERTRDILSKFIRDKLAVDDELEQDAAITWWKMGEIDYQGLNFDEKDELVKYFINLLTKVKSSILNSNERGGGAEENSSPSLDINLAKEIIISLLDKISVVSDAMLKNERNSSLYNGIIDNVIKLIALFDFYEDDSVAESLKSYLFDYRFDLRPLSNSEISSESITNLTFIKNALERILAHAKKISLVVPDTLSS